MAQLSKMIRVLALCTGLVPGLAMAQQAAPAPPVTVVTLSPQDVTLTSLLPGRVAASAEAEVRPQVNGIITERLFDEGADVTMGDPLYQIDTATYEAAVRQARATVAQAEARLRAAEREARRLVELQARNVASEQALDEATSTRDSAAAGLDLAEAQLNSAEIRWR
jgi:membrane fusion protein (multidrug efflux system)